MSFIKTDHYKKLEKFAQNDVFFNMFFFGPKGSGKTKTIERVHLDLDKPLIRTNISIETDEDSLIGGFRLEDGNTTFHRGPALLAMEQGATLLLDEVDQGHPQRLMCLQSILEGSGYFIKRTNQMVYPKKGFRVWATANTKGSGDETGQYIGAQILNGAMKDRFSAFYEFKYPVAEAEEGILKGIRSDLENGDFKNSRVRAKDELITKLVNWANHVRNRDGEWETDESISTRKLIDILKANYIVGSIKDAIHMCISGYPSDYVQAFMEIYNLFDDSGNMKPGAAQSAEDEGFRFF
jgi:MoxR-like ATPase